MQLTDTLRSILRRWYLFVLGTVLSIGLGWSVYQSVPTTYEASGSVLLMPSEATTGETGNPFLYLGGMTNAVDVLIRRANSTEVRDPLLERFDGAEYSITRDVTTDSPITVINVEAPTPDVAIGLRDVALVTVNRSLDAMQSELDIASDLRIQLREVVVDTEATEDTKTALQLAVVAIGAGLVATFMLTGFADGVLTTRRERHMSDPGGPPTGAVLSSESKLVAPAVKRAQAGPELDTGPSGSPPLDRQGKLRQVSDVDAEWRQPDAADTSQ